VKQMVKMTMIEALGKLAELNDYKDVLVQTNGGEPKIIEYAIEDEQRAEDPDELFDLRVTEDSIRKYDENGYFDNNEPLYEVLRDIVLYDDLSEELKKFIKSTSFFTVDEYNIVIDDGRERVTIDQIEEQKTYYETGEL
jgi:hypothetical protein